jgi:hypothetical protein
MSQMVTHPAGWYTDPLDRHQHRYWDGTRWTVHVADHGVASVDLPDESAPSAVGGMPSAGVGAVPQDELGNAHGWAKHDGGAAAATATAPSPGWYTDPLGAHEHRYWDETGWTDHVADGGVVGLDPLASPDPAPDVWASLTAVAMDTSVDSLVETPADATEDAEADDGVDAVATSAFSDEDEPESSSEAADAERDPDAERGRTVAGLVIAVGAALAAAGSFMSWQKATAADIGTISRVGTDVDGAVTVIVGILLLGIATLMIRGRIGAIGGICALILSVCGLALVAINIVDLDGKSADLFPEVADVTVSVGFGLWACGAGLAIAAFGSILAIKRR